MEKTSRQTWIVPQIQRYGTFEQKTQSGCDKLSVGAMDGFSFSGSSIVCAS